MDVVMTGCFLNPLFKGTVKCQSNVLCDLIDQPRARVVETLASQIRRPAVIIEPQAPPSNEPEKKFPWKKVTPIFLWLARSCSLPVETSTPQRLLLLPWLLLIKLLSFR